MDRDIEFHMQIYMNINNISSSIYKNYKYIKKINSVDVLRSLKVDENFQMEKFLITEQCSDLME